MGRYVSCLKLKYRKKHVKLRSFEKVFDYLIQLIWNISENKLDFQDFRNILDKVKYLGPNLQIKALFLTNNRVSTLTKSCLFYLFYHFSANLFPKRANFCKSLCDKKF